MIFIYETKISEIKRIDLSMQECFGVGKYISRCILVKLGFNFKIKQKQISKKVFSQLDLRILNNIEKIFFFRIESKLRNHLARNIKAVKNLKNYKSLRHFMKLPVRGQRTKNNAQTQKKKRKDWRRVAIAKKKK